MPTPKKYSIGSGETRWKIRYRTAAGRSTDKSGFATKKRAEEWYADTILAKASGRFTTASDQKVKIAEFIQRHLDREVGLAPTTIANRKSIGVTWVRPYWEGWAVAAIRKPDVEDWIERISKDGAGADTVQKAHGILLAALNGAVERDLIVVNPASRVRIPKPAKAANQYLSHNEVAELAGEIDPRSRTLVGLLAYTGLRFGEASALRVGSIHLTSRRVTVTHSITSVNGSLVEGPTKSNERRDLYFPSFLREPLRARVEHRAKDQFLFTAERGGNIRLDDWRPRAFYPAIARINEKRLKEAAELRIASPHLFPDITPHDLRHTAASLAVSAGANVKALQRMLGHASASMTLDRYADLFEDDLVSVADALGEQAAERTDVRLWQTK